MSHSSPAETRYRTGAYLVDNPTWDVEDSPWKASLVATISRDHGLRPKSIVDVGCGAGVVLAELRREFPDALMSGYELAPAASQFWDVHAPLHIQFVVGDFLAYQTGRTDLLLVLDVVEHVADPLSFLTALRERARYFIFHIPLDLSAVSVARELPLLHARRRSGHIHYFTKGLALELLSEAGYRVIDCRYTGAWRVAPRRGIYTRLGTFPRRVLQIAGRDLAARLLGGETLLILATDQALNS